MAFFSSIDTGLSSYPGEIADKALHKELVFMYRAFQNLQLGIDRIHRGVHTYLITIGYGQLVTFDGSGVSPASASSLTPLPAYGFCPTPAGVTTGSEGEVQYLGILAGLSGLAAGSIYYLSPSVPGAYTAIKPVAAGDLIQPIGVAISTSALFINPTFLYGVA